MPGCGGSRATGSAAAVATTKVDGTDNVYIFRHGNHQSMFVVTSAGVIATDPIGYERPQTVTTYIDEIRKVSNRPIKYVIYSHHHFDHIAGGKPFKDAGATFVAHKRAQERLAALKDPHTVLFAVDFMSAGSLPGLAMIDSYPIEWEDSLKKVLAMDWDKLIPAIPVRRMDDSAQAGRAKRFHVPAGRVGRGEGRGPSRQVLAAGREGVEAAVT